MEKIKQKDDCSEHNYIQHHFIETGKIGREGKNPKSSTNEYTFTGFEVKCTKCLKEFIRVP